ncbi:MAG: hypothetical protein M3177_06125 [Pseudomonadota bacterium]|nr:hypothetical protein [Pseudomonadota bacterium]
MTSIWDRLFGRGQPLPSAPANDGVEAVLADVRQRVDWDVAAGFYEAEDIVRGAVDYVSDELPAAEVEPHARRFLAEALAAQMKEQESWPASTDCDRLDAAFAALERGGIVARQNFTCCGTCGSYEIWDEIKAFQEGGRRAYGYVFYHMQDTEAAVDGGGLFLNYGACEEGEEPAIATGRAIVAELERHGLQTDWDGSWEKRIGVALDWKRRRRASP